ncbi:MAG: uncharacterized protein PWQ82_322 [Thermosediminibacterales bacterium]|nr:uncharacterized protein [Thermosediminibacterales bacterium]
MLGTIVNVLSIIAGSFVGIILKKGIPDRAKTTLMQVMGIVVLMIGTSMALKTKNVLVVLISLVLGGITGEALNIEKKLNQTAELFEQKIGEKSGDFAKAFVSASLVYCVGAMAILGSLESGLSGNHTTLYVKSVLDGITSIMFSSSMGIGVMFSAIPVFVYQGTITLGASIVKTFLNDDVIREMTATGGILILGIGLNILEIKNIRVANLLPAVFIAIITALIAF